MAQLHGQSDVRIIDDSALLGSLTLAQISATNLDRAMTWHKGGIEEWSVADWGCAMGGEAGECLDAIKKLRRVEESVPSNNRKQPEGREAAIKAIAQEIGDTFLYLDLLAARLGLKIEDCIVETFNRVSVRENLPQRL